VGVAIQHGEAALPIGVHRPLMAIPNHKRGSIVDVTFFHEEYCSTQSDLCYVRKWGSENALRILAG
jgi:hypothetical protein